MNLRISQECPQCGAPSPLQEGDRLLTCSYCGVRNFLHTSSTFRYLLPPQSAPGDGSAYLLVPYIRLKGTFFQVRDSGISHRVIDTTRLAASVAGAPPTLGVRPQAMQLEHVGAATPGRFLPQTIKPRTILDAAATLSPLKRHAASAAVYREYIGEKLSIIYLPLNQTGEGLTDAVNKQLLPSLPREEVGNDSGLKTTGFHPQWQTRFIATLCPHCGADLHGAPDTLVAHCLNCTRAWLLTGRGLQSVSWLALTDTTHSGPHLPFWRMTGTVAALDITSFADFVVRTNQPVVCRRQWHRQPMAFYVPAFKLRPKTFLQAGRRATTAQIRLPNGSGPFDAPGFPVTLPPGEARQAAALVLAAAAASPRQVIPLLPRARLQLHALTLVYLPFTEQGHDLVQPHTGVVLGRNHLRFGRAM